MMDFISEDEVQTFDGWLRYQRVDPTTTTQEELTTWRQFFDEASEARRRTPKVGLMKLKDVPGEYRYAVAVREGVDLWLTLWVRRSRRGEFFIMMPRGDSDWDPHTSYHLDGTLHMKSHDRKVVPPQRRQPLTAPFKGSEHLGSYYGHGPKTVGAVCAPADFAGIVEVAPGILGLNSGGVTVDLIEPGHQPASFPWGEIVERRVFQDIVPGVVITVGRGVELSS